MRGVCNLMMDCRSARESSGQGDCKLKLSSNVVAFLRNEKIASDSSVRAGDTVVHRQDNVSNKIVIVIILLQQVFRYRQIPVLRISQEKMFWT